MNENSKESIASLLSTTSYNVIYMCKFDESFAPKHKGCIKIGKTSINTSVPIDNLFDNSPELMKASEKRISEWSTTSGFGKEKHKIIFTSLAINNKNEPFLDNDFRRSLYDNGVAKKRDDIGEEWVEINEQLAIDYYKQFKKGIKQYKQTNQNELKPYWEQQNGIDKTVKYYIDCIEGKISNRTYLWDVIMRTGKTLMAYWFIQKVNEKNKSINKVLILTHRLNVKDSWYKDASNVFKKNDFQLASKKDWPLKWDDLNPKKPFIYFTSIQDLSNRDKTTYYNLNSKIYDTEWDLIIYDEGHEGNLTKLSMEMHNNLNTKFSLYLSGTPFNLINFGSNNDNYQDSIKFNDNNIYKWDYIHEQAAKKYWSLCEQYGKKTITDLKIREEINDLRKTYFNNEDIYDPNIPNPYFYKPSLIINPIKIDTKKLNFAKETNNLNSAYFKFDVFFDTDNNGQFIHKDDVLSWLKLIFNNNVYKNNDDDIMPFSNKNRDYNKHSLWCVPSVASAHALRDLILENQKFGLFPGYKIIDATGSNTDSYQKLKELQNAIGNNPDQTRTITLTYDRLTVGTTVPEWTCVLMLNNTSSVSKYLQTIFRCKTPWIHNGTYKKSGVVYDFDPDRCLNVIYSYCKKNSNDTRLLNKTIDILLNYLNVISFENNKFKLINTQDFLSKVEKLKIRNIVDSGFFTSDVVSKDVLSKFNLKQIKQLNEELKPLSIGSGSIRNKALKVQLNKNNVNGADGFSYCISGPEILKLNNENYYYVSVVDEYGESFNHNINGKWTIDVVSGDIKNIAIKETSNSFILKLINDYPISLNILFKSDKLNGTLSFSVEYKGESINNVRSLEEPENKKKNEYKKTIDYLKYIAVRFPLIILSLNDNDLKNFDFSKFPSYIKENEDWDEFLYPITKEKFYELIKESVFDINAMNGAAKLWVDNIESCLKINNFEDRVNCIKEWFDKIQIKQLKETVLTPWNVVERQFNITDIDIGNLIKENKGRVALIDINAKSGLYPLKFLLEFYRYYKGKVDPVTIIKKHIFVNCKTTTARKITRRVLGIRDKMYDDWADNHIVKYDIYKKYLEYSSEK